MAGTLLGTGAFATVDAYDSGSADGSSFAVPTAALLATYHAVIVLACPGHLDPDLGVLLGDRLAAYYEQGGGIVVTVSANMMGSKTE